MARRLPGWLVAIMILFVLGMLAVAFFGLAALRFMS